MWIQWPDGSSSYQVSAAHAYYRWRAWNRVARCVAREPLRGCTDNSRIRWGCKHPWYWWKNPLARCIGGGTSRRRPLATLPWRTCECAGRQGRNPLHVLVHEARLEIPTQPLRRNEVFPSVGSYGGTPGLGSRQRDQSVEVARLLLKHGVDVDAKDGTGRTVGEIARARKYQDVLNLLPDSSHTVVPSRM